MRPADRRRVDADEDPDATRSRSSGAADAWADPTDEDDPRLLAAVQEYLAALEAGGRPSRGEWLARYPDIADKLSEYLDGLAFVHSAAGRMAGNAALASDDPSASGPDVEPLCGRPLGDFQLLREIGRGGMGVVYEAEQLSLGRRVAVKVLPLASALDGRHLQRFKNEAHAAAHLHHTNIVPVYAVGCERSVHFYAMQLIDGRSLADVIRELRKAAGRAPAEAAPSSDTPRGVEVGRSGGSTARIVRKPPRPVRPDFSSAVRPSRPSTPTASAAGTAAVAAVTAQALSSLHSVGGAGYFQAVARLAFQAADALDYAHQLGVVHRDIKPANLLLDTRGTLWVTDFGLAQMYTDTGLTQPGDLVGTLRYMSPEQATGRAVVLDQRTDVYSLGVTLFELLTLERAVPGKTREQLLYAIGYSDPRPARSIDRAIPADLETVVAKAMAKDPAERYPTARAMADDLWRFLQSEPILARPPSAWDKAVKWARRHKSVTVSAVAVLLVLAAGLLTSTVLIARAQAKTQAAYKRERQRAAEATEQRAIADRQRAVADAQRALADKSYQRAHEVLDLFTEFATEDLAAKPELADLRKDMLETSLAYYQDFIEDRKDDPSAGAASAALAQSRERATAILQDLTAFDDLFRVTTRSELLPQRAVREELKLAPDGGKEDGTGEFVPNSWRKLLGDRDLGRMGPAERRACLADVAARIDAKLNQVLTVEQAERLRQIHRQTRGAAAFRDPDVAAALSLTRDQKARIRAIQTKSRGGGGGDRFHGFGRPQDWQHPPDDAVRDLVALLTPEQAEKWEELVGPPFKGTLTPNDRGPGGPGRPGGMGGPPAGSQGKPQPPRGGPRRDP